VKVVDQGWRDECSRHHSGDRISASNVANIFQTRDSEGRRTEEDRRVDESRMVSLETNLTRSEDVNCKVHRVELPKIGCDERVSKQRGPDEVELTLEANMVETSDI